MTNGILFEAQPITTDPAKAECISEGIYAALGPERLSTVGISATTPSLDDANFTPIEDESIAQVRLSCLGSTSTEGQSTQIELAQSGSDADDTSASEAEPDDAVAASDFASLTERASSGDNEDADAADANLETAETDAEAPASTDAAPFTFEDAPPSDDEPDDEANEPEEPEPEPEPTEAPAPVDLTGNTSQVMANNHAFTDTQARCIAEDFAATYGELAMPSLRSFDGAQADTVLRALERCVGFRAHAISRWTPANDSRALTLEQATCAYDSAIGEVAYKRLLRETMVDAVSEPTLQALGSIYGPPCNVPTG